MFTGRPPRCVQSGRVGHCKVALSTTVEHRLKYTTGFKTLYKRHLISPLLESPLSLHQLSALTCSNTNTHHSRQPTELQPKSVSISLKNRSTTLSIVVSLQLAAHIVQATISLGVDYTNTPKMVGLPFCHTVELVFYSHYMINSKITTQYRYSGLDRWRSTMSD